MPFVNTYTTSNLIVLMAYISVISLTLSAEIKFTFMALSTTAASSFRVTDILCPHKKGEAGK
jgi:hypothetical protein